jgi:hypothetical protein
MKFNESRRNCWVSLALRAVRGTRAKRGSRGMRPELMMMEWRTVHSIFTVASTSDDGSWGTLRWAIDQANSDDQIQMGPPVFQKRQMGIRKSAKRSQYRAANKKTCIAAVDAVAFPRGRQKDNQTSG